MPDNFKNAKQAGMGRWLLVLNYLD